MDKVVKAKINLMVAACALLLSVTQAQSASEFIPPFALAAAGVTDSEGSDAGDDSADLAKTLANPIGALVT